MKNFFVLLIFMQSLSLLAIDVDSKILATVIGVSETKRTVLINKGSEQGLEMKTHAKFSLPFGMVARGVVVKVSPSRSVWSLYRVFHKDKIEKGIAVLLKVSRSVKLTEDESKELGALADKIDQKVDSIHTGTRMFKKDQKEIAIQMIKDERGKSAYSKADFSSLEVEKGKEKRDSSVDWSGLDGKNDSERFDKSLDYSKLR